MCFQTGFTGPQLGRDLARRRRIDHFEDKGGRLQFRDDARLIGMMRRVVMDFAEDDDFSVPKTVNERKRIADRRGGDGQRYDYCGYTRNSNTSFDWASSFLRIFPNAAASSWRTRSFDRPSSFPSDSSVRG